MYLLHCHSDQSGTWYETNVQDEIVDSQHISTLADCPKPELNAGLVVLLPGEFVRITKLVIPKMRAAERLRAVPYLLEEQLACDPLDVEICYGDVDGEGATTLGVFDKKVFKSQLGLLRDQGLNPDIMLPDYLALILEDNSWTVWATEYMALVRTGKQSGFAVDADNLSDVLSSMLSELEEKDLPERIVCYQDGSLIDVAELKKLSVPIVFGDTPKSGMFNLQELKKTPDFNMLQGEYRPKHKMSTLRRNWWIAAGIAIVWLGVLFGGYIGQITYLSDKEAQLSKQVLSAYQEIFPGSKTILEPRFRVEAILKQLKQEEKSGAFLRVLGVAGRVLNQMPTISLQEINYKDQDLELQVLALNMDNLNQLSSLMRQAGLSVSKKIDDQKDDKILATLTVQEVS